jgi:uncharacterized protein YprB with RNaseH-like and TPR domain
VIGEGLRSRLGELARRRRAGGGVAAAPQQFGDRPGTPVGPKGEAREASGETRPEWEPSSLGDANRTRSRFAVGVEAFLPGGEWSDGRRAVFVHERLRSEIEKPRPHWGRLDEPPDDEPELAALRHVGLEQVLFLDLETGGLSSSPVFLAGTMHWNGEDFVLRQLFARHYGEESALLAALGEAARGFTFLVTFNGKSYDAPFLRDRAARHGVRLALPPRHLDLLHPARRRWRTRLPDCRLQTLEFHVCRRRRAGDVPGDEVPGLYHDFVRRGDPYRLVPVFHHNLLDVITMAEILRALCAARPARSAPPQEAQMEFGPVR